MSANSSFFPCTISVDLLPEGSGSFNIADLAGDNVGALSHEGVETMHVQPAEWPLPGPTWPLDADGNPTATITLTKDSEEWTVSRVQPLKGAASGAIIYLGPAVDAATTTVGTYAFSFTGQTSAPFSVPQRLLGSGPRSGFPSCTLRLAHVAADYTSFGVVLHALASGRPRPFVAASTGEDGGSVLSTFSPTSTHSETITVAAGRDLDLLLVMNQPQAEARTVLLSFDIRNGR